MKPRFCLLVLAISVFASAAANGRKGPTTVWDGVYTDAQAERGQRAFVRSCVGCHREDLSGGDDGEPPLRGPTFTARWDGSTVAALFDFIAVNMPKPAPGSLSLETCIDLVSFILKSNGMPAGRAELPTDIRTLDQIGVTARPGTR